MLSNKKTFDELKYTAAYPVEQRSRAKNLTFPTDRTSRG
jgi:hypothetical protein